MTNKHTLQDLVAKGMIPVDQITITKWAAQCTNGFAGKRTPFTQFVFIRNAINDGTVVHANFGGGHIYFMHPVDLPAWC